MAPPAASLTDLRRELHQIPETGLELPHTQRRVLEALDGLPLEITLGRQLSSITAVLRGGAAPADGQYPVVLLRADMDALPVVEQTGLSFASTNGNMHACGHDLHMAMLIGAAHDLCARAADLRGDVVLMFQPGEESLGGAKYMIEEGVLDAAGKRPDAAFALHVFSAGDPHGVFGVRNGTMMASSDSVHVHVTGRGGHGSAPHLAIDPVPAIAQMATEVHPFVTRRFSIFDPVVVTVGKIAAGSADNVIGETGELHATLRAFTAEARERISDELPELFRAIGAAHKVSVDVDLERRYPVTTNDPSCTDDVRAAVTDLFGPDRLAEWDQPLAAAEDFSFVLNDVPGAFIALSAVPADVDPVTAPFNHSAYAVFDDAILDDGARLLSDLAQRVLTR